MTLSIFPESDGKLRLHYPTTTHVGLVSQTDFTLREFEIIRLRDLYKEPLRLEDFIRRPFVHRSRYLTLGKEGKSYKQFYLGCSEEYRSPCQLRVGLFDTQSNSIIDFLARPFEADVNERKLLMKLLERFRGKDFGEFELRIFADDLRLVS